MSNPIRVVLVGVGNRSMIYAEYAEKHPDQMTIVAAVDPDPVKLQFAAAKYKLPEGTCYRSLEELVSEERKADCAINGTMDSLHLTTTLALLEAGYDVLLEKPAATSEQEMSQLYEAAKKWGRIVMVCHVLRYAPFYQAVNQAIEQGKIGWIINIQTAEHVSYDHMVSSYVRGKWNSQERCGSSMLMAKCCHDLDLITWFNADAVPSRVSSFGSLSYFTREHAPEQSSDRCVDCTLEPACPYSAYALYAKPGKWEHLVFPHNGMKGAPYTEAERNDILATGPYGRCAWKCDNDVVDRQSVLIEFENGSTATHNMIGGAAKSTRTLHIIGTAGELVGVLHDGFFEIRKPDPSTKALYVSEICRVDVTGDSHGGGDLRLVEDFLRVLNGDSTSSSYTSLERSIYGHMIGFMAERSRLSGTVTAIPRLDTV